MLPPCNFYWFRIYTTHMAETWLDEAQWTRHISVIRQILTSILAALCIVTEKRSCDRKKLAIVLENTSSCAENAYSCGRKCMPLWHIIHVLWRKMRARIAENTCFPLDNTCSCGENTFFASENACSCGGKCLPLWRTCNACSCGRKKHAFILENTSFCGGKSSLVLDN